MSYRRQARIFTLQALYQYAISTTEDEKEIEKLVDRLLDLDWIPKKIPTQSQHFAVELIHGTLEHLADIDKKIKSVLKHWKFENIFKIDLSILRFSVYSILYMDIPLEVVINEAIEIAKLYGTDDSYKFVNGILERIPKEKPKWIYKKDATGKSKLV